MAPTHADGERIIRVAEANGAHPVVGHSFSFEPPIRAMREIVPGGTLGRALSTILAGMNSLTPAEHRASGLRELIAALQTQLAE